MFLRLWNYLRGYVMIRVTGFSVERFVNLAALRNIFLWNIHPDGAGVTMNVSIRGFKELREPLRKTRCRAKIIEKKGLSFFLHKYQKRKVLGIGILFFIAGLYFLSSFVWVIEIEGNTRLSDAEIRQGLSELGLEPGCLRFLVDTKKVSGGLIENFPDISWVGVRITGTDAKISIVETIPEVEIVDRETPCDIVAKKDGVIVSIAVSAGTPLVRQKDVVSKGDILVSSEVVIMEGDEEKGREYIRAQAAIVAKLWYTITEETPLQFIEKTETGQTLQDSSVVIRDSEINVIKPTIPYEKYDAVLISDTPLAIGDYQFPLSKRQYEYREYTEVEKEITEEEAKAILEQKIRQKIIESLPKDSEIVDTEITYTKEGNALKASALLTVQERIDEERETTNENGRDAERGEDDQH